MFSKLPEKIKAKKRKERDKEEKEGSDTSSAETPSDISTALHEQSKRLSDIEESLQSLQQSSPLDEELLQTVVDAVVSVANRQEENHTIQTNLLNTLREEMEELKSIIKNRK